jgi:hypothetical protein
MAAVSVSVTSAAAERALAGLAEMSADLRACAIVDGSGNVLAASADNEWGPAVERIWRAADEIEGGRVSQVHVATGDGEMFAARSGELTAIGLSARHALASLMFCDLRSALREANG